MAKIAGIRFRGAGKIYSFDPRDFDLKTGDKVIVETVKGIEIGSVAVGVREVDDESLKAPLKPVIRIATKADIEEDNRHQRLEKEARKIFKEKVSACGLEMKLVEVEYFFDNSKIMFYYTSEDRVDFRELVKELAGALHSRIELRQIGVRNETQYYGGIGSCGREICCHAFLSDFGTVTIKMAKDQNLPLTTNKISGVCGRLMCCLQNEHETYLHLNENMPGLGDVVKTSDGQVGEVVEKSIIKQKVKVKYQSGKDDVEVKEYSAEDITRLHTKKEYSKLLADGSMEPVWMEQKKEAPEPRERRPLAQIAKQQQAAAAEKQSEDRAARGREDRGDRNQEDRRPRNRKNFKKGGQDAGDGHARPQRKQPGK